MKRLLIAALTAAVLALPVQAQTTAITVNGQPLTPQEGWIAEDTSYVTLRGLHRVLEGTQLDWDGKTATLSREDFSLTAQPGGLYITVNDRALYVENGVQVPNGYTAIPTRLVAEALAGTAVWDEASSAAQLTTGVLEPNRASYDPETVYWLSAIISAESRGESLLGQIGVGNVVMNRLNHWRYPDNVYDVIFDTNFGTQFEPTANGTIYDTPTDQCIIAAKLVLEGADVVGDCLYFFAPALSQGTWIRGNTQYVMTIGCHQFYRDWS